MQGSTDVRGARKSGGLYRSAAWLGLAFLAGCFTTPVTGRSSFNPTPVSTDRTIGAGRSGNTMLRWPEGNLKDTSYPNSVTNQPGT